MKNLILFFTLFVAASIAFGATTGKIAGRVVDAENDEPLPGVNVVITGTMMGSTTDIEGDYFIINVPPGVYSVSAQMVGYTQVTKKEVRVKIDQTTKVDFQLETTVLEGEEVVIVAERPVVEVDLTASKETMSGDEIMNSFVSDIKQAVSTQQGVNVNGGIRGGFGLDESYYVDGMENRDSGSNSNYANVNRSAIQEVQLMTGGYNAEYGRANGAIVNIVTKTAKDRMHGKLEYKYRPPGIYHWGGHIYDDPNLFENRVAAANPDYWEGSQNHALFENWSNLDIMRFFREYYISNQYVEDIRKYDDRAFHEIEGTFYGPIVNKLSFMVSGRYQRNPGIFPGTLPMNHDWHTEGNVIYDFSSNTKIKLKVLRGGFVNSQQYRTLYGSSEDYASVAGQTGAAIISPFYSNKFYPYHWRWSTASWAGGKGPEYVDAFGGQFKVSHTFNPSTFLEVQYSLFQFEREATLRKTDIIKDGFVSDEGFAWHLRGVDPTQVGVYPTNSLLWRFAKTGMPFGQPVVGNTNAIDYAQTYNHTIKADLTSQLSDVHQVKAGALFSFQEFDKYWQNGAHTNAQLNNLIPFDHNPWEGAAYVQDKIETKGMIINLGARLDMFNANTYVSDDIFDPLRIHEDTPGNQGLGVVSIGDIYEGTRRGIGEEDEYAVKTDTHMRISPRIGISHPITETTVLHFMYGHFYQRPAWLKMTSLPTMHCNIPAEMLPDKVPVIRELDVRGGNDHYWIKKYWNTTLAGNPEISYEKMIQYEIGFDQSISDLLRLDLTMYYKDGKDLTSAGFVNDEASLSGYGTSSSNFLQMYGNTANPNGGMRWFRMQGQNMYQDVRGLEVSLETLTHKWGNVRIDYNLAFSNTGIYGFHNMYRVLPDGTRASGYENTYYGPNNGDRGAQGNDNERWQANNTVKILGNLFIPENFGPSISGISLLGGWNVNFQTTWAQGFRYTYHAPDDPSTEPLNMRWKDYINTNLYVSKAFPIAQGIRAIFNVRVLNLFDQNVLRLPASGEPRRSYHEEGILPRQTIGYGDFTETIDDVWSWYELRQLPRQIIWGCSFEF